MYINEHILAKHYGWSLSEIRGMDLQDFYVHLKICSVREIVEKEFEAKMLGASNSQPVEEKKITQIKRQKSGAITKTEQERFTPKSKVGSLKIDKSGKVVSFEQPPLT